jgi:hypothetical protein
LLRFGVLGSFLFAGRLRRWGRGSGGWSRDGFVDGGDDLADFYLLTFTSLDVEDAGFLGGYFRGDLVGLKGEENVAGLDGFPILFVPGGDEAAGD